VQPRIFSRSNDPKPEGPAGVLSRIEGVAALDDAFGRNIYGRRAFLPQFCADEFSYGPEVVLRLISAEDNGSRIPPRVPLWKFLVENILREAVAFREAGPPSAAHCALWD